MVPLVVTCLLATQISCQDKCFIAFTADACFHFKSESDYSAVLLSVKTAVRLLCLRRETGMQAQAILSFLTVRQGFVKSDPVKM